MSKGSINKVVLIGNLGKDPEVRHTDKGTVANLSLATMQSWKDKATGEKKELTEWHRIVIFGKLADIVNSFVGKGDKLYIGGRLQTDKYQRDGIDHYTTKIVGEEMQILVSKNKPVSPHPDVPPNDDIIPW